MRAAFVLGVVFAVAGVCSGACAETLKADSKIDRVVVYPGSALVTRVAKVDVAAGEHEVLFEGIVPDVNEDSLRAAGRGTASVKILGTRLEKEFRSEEQAPRVKELQAKREALEDKARRLDAAHDVNRRQAEFFDSLRFFAREQLPEDLVTKVPPVKEIEELAQFLQASLKQNRDEAMELQDEMRQVQKDIEVVRRELGELSRPGKAVRSVAVDVQVAKAGSLTLELTYAVSGATWQPVYDARASFEKGTVEIVSYGVVRQSTGEDWTDVAVRLSTARVGVFGRMPEATPWFLRVFAPPPMVRRDSGGLLMAKAALTESRESEAMRDEAWADAQAIAGSAAPVEQEAAYAYAGAQEKGAGVLYELPRRATIKADGSQQKLPIGAQELKAEFVYAAFPRLSDYAYLRATVVNDRAQHLLAGPVNVFLEGDYVGRSGIDTTGPGEKLDISLGIDENVKVKRELLEEKTDSVLIANIPSPDIKVTRVYKATVENYRSQPITFNLFEATPVPQDERIKARVVDVSPEPKEKDWRDRKGVWRWEFGLAPQAKQEVSYTFIIERPKNLSIEGL